MRKKIVAGNWKMNTNLDEALKLTSEVVNMVKDEIRSEVQLLLTPPFTNLYPVKKLIENQSNIHLAAQNCHHRPSGAFTGEISAAMLKSLGVSFVLVGHSERRQYFHENDALLAEKVNIVLENAMSPVFCCGETLEERENTDFIALVCGQLSESLFHLSAEQIKQVVIAYEPVWAIGTGKTATAQQAQDMQAALRKHVSGKYGQAVADELCILYGGSVNATTAQELFAMPDVDGGLVGGASLKSRDFVNIAKSF
jgi:triosephosphate isomerase (TIM)